MRFVRRCAAIESVGDEFARTGDIAGAKRLDRFMQRGFGLALPLGLRAPRPLDVRTCTIVLPIEKQHAGPEIDRVFVALGEVFVEAGEQQMLNPRVTFGTAQRLSGTHVGTQRIH